MWGLLSSFRNKLNFENRTIIKEVTGIFVKKCFCQKRVLRYHNTNSNIKVNWLLFCKLYNMKIHSGPYSVDYLDGGVPYVSILEPILRNVIVSQLLFPGLITNHLQLSDSIYVPNDFS